MGRCVFPGPGGGRLRYLAMPWIEHGPEQGSSQHEDSVQGKWPPMLDSNKDNALSNAQNDVTACRLKPPHGQDCSPTVVMILAIT